MHVFLQTNSSTVGLVNAAVIVLVIVFLTLPTVFVLAEYLRNRRRREGTAVAIATAGPPMADAAPSPEPVAQPKQEATINGIRILPSAMFAHDFTREAVPPEIGVLAGDRRIDGPITFQGHLQVEPRSSIVGPVLVSGSLALGEGCTVVGDVRIGGNLYLRPGARVDGSGAAGGNGFLASWARLRELDAGGTVELEQGAGVDVVLRARRVVQVARVDDPRLRPEEEAQRTERSERGPEPAA